MGGNLRTVWIVDGGYLFDYAKTRPKGFDYLKLKNAIVKQNGGPLYESYFLNSVPDNAGESLHGFTSWLKSAPPAGPQMRVHLYKLKNIHTRCPACSHQFDRQEQKGVDVGIATLMIKLAVQNVYDRLILSAGDGDFEDAISYVKSDLHKEIWINGSQANLSTDLQSYADRVLWLDDMTADIDR